MSGAPFEAKYNGRCQADCGWPIQEGEPVTYVDDQLVHADCATSHTLRERVEAAVCPSCWMTMPCDCEADQ